MNASRNGHVEFVEAVARDMKEKGVTWNEKTYNLILTAYAKRKDSRMASRYLDQMKKELLPLDSHIYTTMIGLQARCGRLKEGFQLLKESSQSPNSLCEWKTFQTMMARAIDNDDLPQAEAVLEIAKKANVEGIKHLYDSLIQAYACRENIPRIRALIDQMVESGIFVRPFVLEMLRKYEERDQLNA